MDEKSPAQIDGILVPFLRTRDESQSEELLARLIMEQAEPTIREIIGYKLRTLFHLDSADGQEAEDLYSDVVLSLIGKLRGMKGSSEAKAVANFRSYVAVTTYNACNKHLRKKYPQRNGLKNQLRYLFSSHIKLAVWEDSRGELVCGQADWRIENDKLASSDDVKRVYERVATPGSNNLVDVVLQALECLGSPIELDEMVGIVAGLTGVKDQQTEPTTGAHHLEAVDPLASPDRVAEMRDYLKLLWGEIRELPLRQRIALLLNLKDEQGRNQLAAFPVTGVASIRAIAISLEMTDEELASLWNQLPLEDLAIARRLSITRQQVINLRKSARERLHRRMNPKQR